MKKNLYKLTYTPVILLLAALHSTYACEVEKNKLDETTPTPFSGVYFDPSNSRSQQKKNFNPEKKIKDSESETPLMNEKEKPIVIDYRDKHIVLAGSKQALWHPDYPHLEDILKTIPENIPNKLQDTDFRTWKLSLIRSVMACAMVGQVS